MLRGRPTHLTSTPMILIHEVRNAALGMTGDQTYPAQIAERAKEKNVSEQCSIQANITGYYNGQHLGRCTLCSEYSYTCQHDHQIVPHQSK